MLNEEQRELICGINRTHPKNVIQNTQPYLARVYTVLAYTSFIYIALSTIIYFYFRRVSHFFYHSFTLIPKSKSMKIANMNTSNQYTNPYPNAIEIYTSTEEAYWYTVYGCSWSCSSNCK